MSPVSVAVAFAAPYTYIKCPHIGSPCYPTPCCQFSPLPLIWQIVYNWKISFPRTRQRQKQQTTSWRWEHVAATRLKFHSLVLATSGVPAFPLSSSVSLLKSTQRKLVYVLSLRLAWPFEKHYFEYSLLLTLSLMINKLILYAFWFFFSAARVPYQLACICWLMQGFINQIHKMVLGLCQVGGACLHRQVPRTFPFATSLCNWNWCEIRVPTGRMAEGVVPQVS